MNKIKIYLQFLYIAILLANLSALDKTSFNHRKEPTQILSNASYGSSPIVTPNTRNYSEFTLVDSSSNGYGLYSPTTHPLFYNFDEEIWFIAYRDGNGISGAYSEDGTEWEVTGGINNVGGTVRGKYPSALGVENTSIVIWNEYTDNISNGALYGGRPYYAYDEYGWYGGSFSIPRDVSFLYEQDTDGKDLWTASPAISLNHDSGQHFINIVFPDWTRGNSYFYHSEGFNGDIEDYDNSALFPNEYLIFDMQNDFEGSYGDGSWSTYPYLSCASNPDNDTADEICATAVVGRLEGSDAWNGVFRMSYNHGSTWAPCYGSACAPSSDGLGYNIIPDEVFNDIVQSQFPAFIEHCDGETYSVDSFNIAYNGVDFKIDSNGNPHFIIPITPSDEDVGRLFAEASGLYHFTIDKEHLNNPGSVNSSTGWNWSFVMSGLSTWPFISGTGDVYFNETMASLSFSLENPDIIYVTTDMANPGPFALDQGSCSNSMDDMYPEWSQDIFVIKSLDNGQSWWNPLNVTNTPDMTNNDCSQYGNYIPPKCGPEEIFPHAYQWATDEEVYIMYQTPNWGSNSFGDITHADYMNRIYVGKAIVDTEPLLGYGDSEQDLLDCADEPYELIFENQEFAQINQSENCFEYILFGEANNAFNSSNLNQDDFIYINFLDFQTSFGEGVYKINNIINQGPFSRVQVMKDANSILDCSAESYTQLNSQTDITIMYVLNNVDVCNVCNGDNSTCLDCAGIPNGNSVPDQCGVCDDDSDNDCTQDCNGEWGGSFIQDCFGVCGGDAILDDCNVCDGDNSTCLDCNGIPFGDAALDQCGVCDNDLSNDCQLDCNGDWGGNALQDSCGICSGGNTGFEYNAFLDCYNECFGNAIEDECGVCNGDGSSCLNNGEVFLRLTNLDNEGSFDIEIKNDYELSGLQFSIDGIEIQEIESDDFLEIFTLNSFDPNTGNIIGISLNTGYLPINEEFEKLLTIRYVNQSNDICIIEDGIHIYPSDIPYPGSDANWDGTITVQDPIFILDCLLGINEAAEYECLDPPDGDNCNCQYLDNPNTVEIEGDLNGDGSLNIVDILYLVNEIIARDSITLNFINQYSNSMLVNVDYNSSCSNNQIQDCAGTLGGSAVEDECGICDGDGSSCSDCAGTPNGTAVVDECGICDGDGSSCNTGSNYVLSFDGDDDRVQIPGDVFYNLNQVTFSCWFYKDNSDLGLQTIIQQAYGLYIRYETNEGNPQFSNVLWVDGQGSYQINVEPPEPYKWHNLALTYDDNFIIVYLNGDQIGSIQVSGSVFNNQNIIYIGNYLTQEGFGGKIDEMAIWNTALSQEQIQNNMLNYSVNNDASLVGYWKFDAGNGTILYDQSGNQNHGTIYGATWEEYQEDIYGCTDPLAENYNTEANFDDGTCFGSPVNYDDFYYFGELNEHHYYVSNSKATWEDAKNICIENGGHSVIIDSELENEFIGQIPNLDDNISLGISDIEEEGVWKSTLGQIIWIGQTDGYAYNGAYTNWADYNNDGSIDEPNDLYGQDCGVYYLNNGTWDDYGCTALYYYVLEIPDSVNGCTDPLAENYNTEANSNDGSCEYPNEGNNSLSFSSGQRANIPVSEATTNLESLTLELWYYEISGEGEWIVGFEREGGSTYAIDNDWGEYETTLSGLESGCAFSAPGSGGGYPITRNVWTHLALTYDGSYTYFFVDGQMVYSQECDIGPVGDPTSSIDINYHTWGNGGSYSSRLTGNIDELRISNIARYTSDFTPPNNEFEPDENTVGLWHFNNNFYDYSGNQNHGTHYGSGYSDNTPITNMIFGCTDSVAENYNSDANQDDNSCTYPDNGNYALSFDGYDDFILLPDILVGTNYTLEANIKLLDHVENQDHYSIISGWEAPGQIEYACQFGVNADNGYDYDNKISFHKTTVGSVGGAVQGEEFERFIISKVNLVRNDNNYKIYVDNNLVVESGGHNFTQDMFNRIGTWVYNDFSHISNRETWNGEIYDLKIWNYAFSEEEINQNQSNDNSDNLIVDYHFNSGAGEILYDHSGNGYHGSIDGAMWIENIEGCTDEYADNYNSEADIDNGSCSYPIDSNDYMLEFNAEGGIPTAPGPQYNGEYARINELNKLNQFSVGGTFILYNSDGSGALLQHKNTDNAGDGWLLGFDNGVPRILFINGETGYIHGVNLDNYTFPLNVPFDIVLTAENNGDISLYINGELEFEYNTPNFPSTLNIKEPFYMGHWWDGNTSFYTSMSLLESFYTNSIINAENINTYDPMIDEDLIFKFLFTENNNEILYDISGNQNHGEFNGPSWVQKIEGCFDDSAYNYNPEANIDDNSCCYTDGIYDCQGNCLSDQDNDEICDENDACPNDPENDIDGDGICCNFNENYDFNENYGLRLNGNDRLTITDSFNNLSNELTIITRINIVPNGHTERIFSRTADGTDNGEVDRYHLGMTSSDKIEFCINDGNGTSCFTSTETILSNEFYNIALTFENGNVQLYINGEISSSGNLNYSNIPDLSGADLFIGGAPDNFTQFYGLIDNLLVFHSALNVNEIQSYNNFGTINYSSLDAYWDFNEGNGSHVSDLSGNLNHGIISCTDGTDLNPDGVCDGDSIWEFIPANIPNDICCYDSENDADGDGICESDEILGCQDENSCDYNPDATDTGECNEYPEEFYDCNGNCIEIGCSGECDGSYMNLCGVCVLGITGNHADMGLYCDGNCWSFVEEDECGVCNGDNSSCADCEGTPNGDAYEDGCGTCDNNPDNDCVDDCNGDLGGSAFLNACFICVGGNTGLPEDLNVDCNGECGGSAEIDDCGVCDGNNECNNCEQTLDLYLCHCAGGGYINEGITLTDPSGQVEEYCDGGCSTGNWSSVNHEPATQCANMANVVQQSSNYFDAECIENNTVRFTLRELETDGIASIEVSDCGTCGIWSINGDLNPIGQYDFSCNEIIVGCTDSLAENYNIEANSDDGNCSYPDNGDYSLIFDGLDDYVQPFNSATSSELSEFTVSCKVNMLRLSDYLDSQSVIIRQGVGGLWDLGYDEPLNSFSFGVYYGHPSWYKVFSPAPLNEWVTIHATYDQNLGEIKMYINGNLADVEQIPNSDLAPTSYPLTFGGVSDSGQKTVDAIIDNIKIWNQSLSDEEILSDINLGINMEENLLGYWKFNEGDGNISYDHSGNQNHGTINGATWEEYQEDIFGCIDSLAENYNADANQDDGSCAYLNSWETGLNFYDSRDSQSYGTIQIGDQIWFSENLNIDENRYCYNDISENCDVYGGLYKYEDMFEGICPEGWKEPEVSDYQILLDNVAASSNSLKAIGQGYGNGTGNNSSGFTALLGGFKVSEGNYLELNNRANFGTISTNGNNSIVMYLFDNNNDITFDHTFNYTALAASSVRCLYENVLYGCTDSIAENYNSNATHDDGSCEYEDDIYSLYFDGNNDYVDLGRPISAYENDEFSISLWFRTSHDYTGQIWNGEEGILITNDTQPANPEFRLGVQVDNSLFFSVGSPSVDISTDFTVNDDVLHHAVAIKEADKIMLYVDGQFISETAFSSSADHGSNLFLGAYRSSGETGSYFGSIDNINVYDRSLEEWEINSLYNNQFINEGIKGRWIANEGNGEILYDYSGHDNHGTIYGVDWINTDEFYSGCSDPVAENYNSDANQDDNSCTYPENGDYLLNFDGWQDNVKFGVDTFDNYDVGAISIDFKALDINTNGHIFNFENIIILKVENENLQVEFNRGNDTFDIITTPINNEWNYAQVKWSANTGELYLNHSLSDVVEFTNSTPNFTMYGDRDNSMGSRYDSGNNFNGNIKNLIVSDYAENQLYGLFLFNTGEGNILYDHSGNQNHGTIYGANWEEYQEDIYGCIDPLAENYNEDVNQDDGSCTYPDNGDYSLSFDGLNDYVSGLSNTLDVSNTNQLTLSVKIEPNTVDINQWIFSHRGTNVYWPQYSMVLENNKIYFISGNGSFENNGGNYSSPSLIDDIIDLSVTYDGMSLKFYINGELDYENIVSDSFTSNSDAIGEFIIGGLLLNNENIMHPFNGEMHSIAVWNQALSASEIENLDISSLLDNSNLIAHWKMNEGQGNIIYDHSGNQNHGTIYGATWLENDECIDCITDIDGNTYETIQIGNQLWMKENLKVTKNNSGIDISTNHTNSEWLNLQNQAIPGYAYDENISNYIDDYGLLYNWYAAVDDVCPSGWRLPRNEEFQNLIDFLGGDDTAGYLLKDNFNWDGSNESQFTALPSGYRSGSSGDISSIGDHTAFWTSTEDMNCSSNNCIKVRGLNSGQYSINEWEDSKNSGYSIRCILDECESEQYDCAGVCDGDAIINECGDCQNSSNVLDACDLPINTIYLDGWDVWYNVDTDIGAFQWNVDGTTVSSSEGGDAAAAGFTVHAAGSTVLGFSFSGALIPAGCGILTQMELSGNATGLSGIIINDYVSNGLDVSYYDGGSADGGCDDFDSDGICDCVDDCVGQFDCEGVCNGSVVEDCTGECGGNAQLDECGVCNGNGIVNGTCDCEGNVEDCAGECGGNAQLDECGDCQNSSNVLAACDLPINTIYLDGEDVWYNVDFDISGFQWNVDGTTVSSIAGGDAAIAGYTLQAAGSTVLGFSFSGALIPAGCGILTQMELSGNATGLSGIIINDYVSNGLDVSYYDGGSADGGCDDFDSDGICDCVDDCVGQIDQCGFCLGYGCLDEEGNSIECGIEPGDYCDCSGSIIDDCGICAGEGYVTFFYDNDGDGHGNSSLPTPFCPNIVPDDWSLIGGDIDDDIYCESNEILEYFYDQDEDGLGCLEQNSMLCQEFVPSNWLENSDDEECDCFTNDTDQCGVCGGTNDCVGCTDEIAFNYNEDSSVLCEDCCIYKPNYPYEWDENGDGLFDDITNYQYSSSITSHVIEMLDPINYNTIENENNLIAAFYNGEQRGFAKITPFDLDPDAGLEKLLFFLLIYSNDENNEEINFKLYNFETDSIIDLAETFIFENNLSLGDGIFPYSFHIDNDFPDWNFNFNQYMNSGSITSKVYINGLEVGSENDIIAAFVDGVPRGYAFGSTVPPFLGEGYAFLMLIYSNSINQEMINFKFYDSSNQEIIDLNEQIEFTNDMTLGDLVNPVNLNWNSMLTYEREVKSGWNWMSFNLLNDDMSINNILESLSSTAQDLDYIKGPVEYAEYFSGHGWFGSFTELYNHRMYKLDSAINGLIEYQGTEIVPSTFPININSGWNWISYIPLENMSINYALSSLTQDNVFGDYIKSQSGYADYYAGFGWYGTGLDSLKSTKGYLIDMSNSSVLTYPNESEISLSMINSSTTSIKDSHWNFDFKDFEFNGSVTIELDLDGVEISEYDQIGAFFNDECRGVAHASTFPLNGKIIFPLMFYSNSISEKLNFKLYSYNSNKIIDLKQQIEFYPDIRLNNALEPFIMTNGLPDEYKLNNVYPNPFNPITTISYSVGENTDYFQIKIYDLRGRLVDTLFSGPIEKGDYSTVWDASNFSSGIYFVYMNTDKNSFTKKIMLIK